MKHIIIPAYVLSFFLCFQCLAEEKMPLAYIGETQTYTTNYEDTFIKIARGNNLGFVELRAANPNLDPWIPGENQEIILPTRHLLPKADQSGLLINLADMRLYDFTDKENLKSYPLGIGRTGLSTPMGSTTVVEKKEGPIWIPTERMRKEKPELPGRVEPGPDNPLGTHALYLGWPEYALHGTNRPFGIGRRVSSGCIRLYPEDIIKLFADIPVGTPVSVVNQPIKTAWINDSFYVEVHPTTNQADRMEKEGGMPSYEFEEKDLQFVLKQFSQSDRKIDWHKLRTAIRERKGYPIAVTK